MDSTLRRIFLEALDVDLFCAEAPVPLLCGAGRHRYLQIRRDWAPEHYRLPAGPGPRPCPLCGDPGGMGRPHACVEINFGTSYLGDFCNLSERPDECATN